MQLQERLWSAGVGSGNQTTIQPPCVKSEGIVCHDRKTVTDAMMNAVQAGQEYHAKVMQLTATNSQAAFDYFQKLAAARAPSEVIALTAAHLREQSDNLTAQATRSWHTWPKSGCQSLGAEAAFEGGLPFGLLRFPCQAGLAACVSLPRNIAAQFA